MILLGYSYKYKTSHSVRKLLCKMFNKTVYSLQVTLLCNVRAFPPGVQRLTEEWEA